MVVVREFVRLNCLLSLILKPFVLNISKFTLKIIPELLFESDLSDFLGYCFGFADCRHLAPVDLVCICKPDGAVVVLRELALHLQDFDVIHTRNKVAHLQTLFSTVLIVVLPLQQFIITSQVFIPVVNTFELITDIEQLRLRCIKVNSYRFAQASPRF